MALVTVDGGFVGWYYIAISGFFHSYYTFASHFGSSFVTRRLPLSPGTSNLEPTSLTSRPLFSIWNHTAVPIGQFVPEKYRIPAAAVLVISVILAATFSSPQTAENNFKNRGISVVGLFIFYGGLYVTSADRKRIVWRTVLVGLLCQFILALFVLRTRVGYDIFNFLSFLAR